MQLTVYLLLIVAGLAAAWFAFRRPLAAVVLVILVNPFEAVFSLPGGMTLGRMAGLLAIAAWVGLLLRDRRARARLRRSRLAVYLWPFLLVCFTGAFVWVGAIGGNRVITQFITVLMLAQFALMIENLVITKREVERVLVAVLCTGALTCIFPVAYQLGFNLYQQLGIDVATTLHGGGRARGLTGNANALGAIGAAGLTAGFILLTLGTSRVQRVLNIVLMFLCAAGLLLSASRTNLAAVILFIGIAGAVRLTGPRRNRMRWLAGVGIAAVMIAGAYQLAPAGIQDRVWFISDKGLDSNSSSRMDFREKQQRHAVATMLSHPLVGVGLGRFRFHNPDGYDVHDTFSATAGETGFLGILTMLILLLAIAMRLLRSAFGWRRHSDPEMYNINVGLLASYVTFMIVSALGGGVMFYQRWFWIMAGLAAAANAHAASVRKATFRYRYSAAFGSAPQERAHAAVRNRNPR